MSQRKEPFQKKFIIRNMKKIWFNIETDLSSCPTSSSNSLFLKYMSPVNQGFQFERCTWFNIKNSKFKMNGGVRTCCRGSPRTWNSLTGRHQPRTLLSLLFIHSLSRSLSLLSYFLFSLSLIKSS